VNELLAVARAAAQDGASVLRQYLGRVRVDEWSQKGVADFVTHVDHAAEAVIVERIRQAFPSHDILAEEAAAERTAGSGVTNGGREWTWIVDPLDGTTNYLHRYPMYGVSVGVARGGEMQAGVVLNVATGEEWSAVRGGGAFLDGTRITVSEIDALPRALIGAGFPFRTLDLLPEYLLQLDATVRAVAGVRRAGSAAIDLCHVATGYLDGFWELTLAPWDVAAGSLIVSEAGGVVTRMDGTGSVLGHGSVLAGNPAMHAALGELLRTAAGSTAVHVD